MCIACVSCATLDSERHLISLVFACWQHCPYHQAPLRLLWGTNFSTISDHKALDSIGNVGDQFTRVQRWLEHLNTFDYTLTRVSKGSTNGKDDFLPRVPQTATEHDCSGSSRFAPVDDSAVSGGLRLTSAKFGFFVHGGHV